MAFDSNWEGVFQSHSWGKYPAEPCVRFISRRFCGEHERSKIRILDLGCGAGANLWYLAREGFQSYGVDASSSAVRRSGEILSQEGLEADLRVCDFKYLPFSDGFFDAVLDLNSVQHNRFSDIQQIHREIWRILKPGGSFFGMLVNRETTGSETAQELEPFTFSGFRKGLIKIDVITHLFSREEVSQLMANYEGVTIDRLLRTDGGEEGAIGHFIVSGRRAL